MSQSKAPYQAYLLRLWQQDAHSGWRASLQAAGSSAVHRFADLSSLVAFLEERTGVVLREAQEDAPRQDEHPP